jgi:prepilin-type processing-associated H-X9-DG protein/prepilin-type N-terminal cleavage/methylation domain-containing protein
MNKNKQAFTLVELLAVITIIAVLAGLLLPVFARVQENGRTTQCTSNLRQIGSGLNLFAADHNGIMPLSGATMDYTPPTSRSTNQALGWTEQLEPYIGTNRNIFTCPSSALVNPNNVPYGYFQGCHAAYFAAGGQFAAIRVSLLAVPSKYILGGDISSNGVFTDANDSDKDDYTQDPAFATTPAPFHNGRVNILFADGHVGIFAAFDSNFMTTHYNLKPDGTGYNYSDQ